MIKLGLDIGTNSIGWALVDTDFDKKTGKILGLGSRIIPMDQGLLGDFEKGNSVSQTSERTRLRSARRLRERFLLRRERLHRVLELMGFLPRHYFDQIDFELELGQFKPGLEPKLAYYNKSFLFKDSFQAMMEEFRKAHSDLLQDGRKVPYDWTIYFLRKKALTEKISKEELAWVILQFNQKRGYYQARGEDVETDNNKSVEFHSIKVLEVIPDEKPNQRGDLFYSLHLENGWVYRRSSKTSLEDWKGKVYDFIVTTELDDDGNTKLRKDGTEKRSFRAPGPDDWTLLKKRTEKSIEDSGKTVGEFIYDSLIADPTLKIRGELVRTIERDLYRDELIKILSSQQRFHDELNDQNLLNDAIRELYRNNENHRQLLQGKNMVYLLVDDILFYQRPLKSKKWAIAECKYEYKTYVEDGEYRRNRLKAAPKSHPLYQEFRLWKWISDLFIYKIEDDVDVTDELLGNHQKKAELFDFLSTKVEIDQSELLKYLGLNSKKYRWNYPTDKKYPCLKTRNIIQSRLDSIQGVGEGFLTPKTEYLLWHLMYSVKDKKEYVKGLNTFANKFIETDIEAFVEAFKNVPPFKSEYGALSEKALRKMVPLMRCGNHWQYESIPAKVIARIKKILYGEYDENISERVRKKSIELVKPEDFQGLQDWLVSYIVYDRHSEAAETSKWENPEDIDRYLEDFKQHSMRNPIVEQILLETLRIVRDVWIRFGAGSKDFFKEIHVELGREMKNTKQERERLSAVVAKNESTNLRVQQLLYEMANDANFESVRPFSPQQQEILKIYEDGVLNSGSEIPEDIDKISKKSNLTSSEITKYKLWLEQKYKSPYTGEIIPLHKLFTNDYEIEHIIPQSLYFDNSQSNKVICEAAVNKLKDNRLGLTFIKEEKGRLVPIGFGKSVAVFDEESYRAFIDQHFSSNRAKRSKLLLEEIPDKMIERQKNDTRYVSSFIAKRLSNIVRTHEGDDGETSKNIIPVSGSVTSILRNDWGLNDVWNELIIGRFERLNSILNTTDFTAYSKNHQKTIPSVPLEFKKGFQKKRIDHRHHALDALVVACATRDHVNLLNNQHAKSNNSRHDLKNKLMARKTEVYPHPSTGETIRREVPDKFFKPWEKITIEAREKLESLVVSFKQNLRVIGKTTNRYEKWITVDGKTEKALVEQTKGDSWAIRKPLHKDTVSGRITLQLKKTVTFKASLDCVDQIVKKTLRKQLKKMLSSGLNKKEVLNTFKKIGFKWEGEDVSKVEIYYSDSSFVASRTTLDTSFDEKKIEKIADSGIRQILINHLDLYKGRKDLKRNLIEPSLLAFSPEGIAEMNQNIRVLNGGKDHQPIKKVRTFEPIGNKFQVGFTGNKSNKFVEAAKGTNLYFVVYKDEKDNRSYETVPLHLVIAHQKWRATLSRSERHEIPLVPVDTTKGELLFFLSPNDLIYVPSVDEAHFQGLSRENFYSERIYKVVSFTGNRLYCVPHRVAVSIADKKEFGVLNKMEFTLDGVSIRENCIKLSSDRLGFIQSHDKAQTSF